MKIVESALEKTIGYSYFLNKSKTRWADQTAFGPEETHVLSQITNTFVMNDCVLVKVIIVLKKRL